jgi:hypothetical protein
LTSHTPRTSIWWNRYPKLRRLQDLKQQLCDSHAHPPLYVTLDPETESPRSLTSLLSHVFDVILIRPPSSYTWPEITAIPIRLLSADPSFVFLWVGSSDGDGLKGREALLKWGFRRCEEIVWIKQNKSKTGKTRGRAQFDSLEGEEDEMPKNLLVNQKEHCLVGIRGTVRRKTDNWFAHCNVGESCRTTYNNHAGVHSVPIQTPMSSCGKPIPRIRPKPNILLSFTVLLKISV